MEKSKGILANTSRSVMAKKFKINDGASKYVETATLLEPANNNSASQNEADEIREVSQQLSQIKKKHDEAKKLGNKKEEELAKVKKEIDQLYVQEVSAEGPNHQIKSKIEMLEESLAETNYKTNEELFTQSQYLHMLDRMKKDFIAAKLQTSSYEGNLKNKSAVLDLEQQKQRKIKEERLQSKQIFEGLMKNIEKEQRERQERIHELQKCIRNKEESVQKRIERQRRNQEIAEAAANENKDLTELKMRDSLQIQKLWNAFMRKKMDNEMRNSQSIDEAFKAIKTATGVTDVQEMVKKFLQREQTYSSLLLNVSDSDRKSDKLKKDNETLRTRLNELKIDAESAEKDEENNKETKFQDEDILESQAQIAAQQKEYGMLQEKYKKINIVNDQISGWAKRVYNKFSALTDDPALHKQPDDMVKVFIAMEHISVTELKQLKMNRDDRAEPDDAFIDLDFATEDFINKNIRVRPISGVSKADETKDGRASNISKGGDDAEDAQDNYNKIAIYEIENQRKQVKKKAVDYQEKLRIQKALEEKKAAKK